MPVPDPSWCARIHAGAVRAEPARAADAHQCERCGARMYEHHCKIVCPNCGYKRDCSDP